nr:hypothetical protein [Gammaproteobacteria bacterium]
SWGLTGSALALSVLFLAGAVFWEQLPFPGDSARSNATGRTDTRSAQKNPEAEFEFALMQPLITDKTAKPLPPTAPEALPHSLSALAPRSTVKSTDTTAAQQPPAAREQAGELTPEPTMKAITEPTSPAKGQATKGVTAEAPAARDPMRTLSQPLPTRTAAPVNAISEQPLEVVPAVPTSNEEPPDSVAKLDRNSPRDAGKPTTPSATPNLPPILEAVDGEVYEAVENNSLDQFTGEILPNAADTAEGVEQLRRYLREAPNVTVESAFSASGALGASSAPTVAPSVGVTGARLF